ncbi:MAG: DUF1080 domain-containing protein [Planctomycetota bacterium]|nr:DUF1080 domain-containing protein [Planctomycetota bacterium]
MARIETKESYGDFELTCEIRLPDAQSRLGEIQFRDYGWVYAIEPESRAWLTLHAAAKGNQITCTLDGKALQPTTDSKRTNLNGKLAFYSNRDWGLSVRNLKIKTLKP